MMLVSRTHSSSGRRAARACCAALAMFVVTAAVAQKVPDVRLNTNSAGSSRSTDSRIASVGSSAYVVWQDSRNGEFDIYLNRSIDRGVSWLASDIRVDTDTPGAARSHTPQIAASGSSVYVTWTDDRNGNGDVYFNRSLDDGATWLTTDVRLDTDTPGAGVSAAPQVAASGSSVYVVWHDLRNVTSDIYFNCSCPSGKRA